jgi:uncharacterized Ntn-hydrolase superfamily protein
MKLAFPLTVIAAAVWSAASLGAQEPTAADPSGRDLAAQDLADPTVSTFSILGYDPETGELGVAVQSRVFSVGNGVIWAKAGVGLVATQAMANIGYGPRALELLASGLTPQQVVERLLQEDQNPFPDTWPESGRQIAVMDSAGVASVWTGPDAPAWAGHKTGANVSVQGNFIAGPRVLDAMVRAFNETRGHLSLRLLAALEAGQGAGGDRRGMQSAAMIVVQKDGGPWLGNDVELRLQVDDHPRPLAELRRLVMLAAVQRGARRSG